MNNDQRPTRKEVQAANEVISCSYVPDEVMDAAESILARADRFGVREENEKTPYQWIMFLMGHGARTVNYKGNLEILLQEALPEIMKNPFQVQEPAPDPVRKEIARAFRMLAEEAAVRSDRSACETDPYVIQDMVDSVVRQLEKDGNGG